MTKLSYEAIERIEGAIKFSDYTRFTDALGDMTNDLRDEGFEYPEIKAFIMLQLDEILGSDF